MTVGRQPRPLPVRHRDRFALLNVTAHSGSHLDDLIHHFMADDVARQHCRNEIVKEVRGSLLPSQAMKVRIKIRNSHFFSDVISAIPDADCRYAQFEARDRWFDCDAPHILVFRASATHDADQS